MAMVVYTFLRERAKRLLARELIALIALSPSALRLPYISLNLHLAKCYRQLYHTTPPPSCQGLFSFGGTQPGGNSKAATPPPARPRAGAHLEGQQQGGPAVYRHPK